MGPGIKQDERVYGASLLDVCPTILAACGLPVGEDMDGKPLANLFESPPEIRTIPSWDEAPGDAGTHPPDMRIDPMEAREAIRQLVDLGYIDKPDENREKAVAQTVRELDYNLARAYMDAGRHADAIPLLEGLVDDWPDEHRFGVQLVGCYEAVGRISSARGLLEEVIAHKREMMPGAREELQAWREAHKEKKPDDLSEQEKRELRDLRARATFNPFAMDFLMGSLLAAEGDEAAALEHLRKAGKADTSHPGLHLKVGQVYLEMKRWDKARSSFERALQLDPDSAAAHRGLAQALLAERRNVDAAEAAMDSVGLLFHNPRGHFLLGVALHRLGEVERAVQALEVAVSQNPNFPEAHKRLAMIHKRRLKDDAKAAEHRRLAREARQRLRDLKKERGRQDRAGLRPVVEPPRTGIPSIDPKEPPAAASPPVDAGPVDLAETITVVAGLPRSGTSMMMQMLEAGGVPILTDGKRTADEDNPRGYYEFEPATRLQKDASWLSEAKGKAVKIVAQLLPHLKPGLAYRVVFMVRAMEEVLRSQQVMLERQGRHGAGLDKEKLAKVYARSLVQIRQVLAARGIPTLHVRFDDCMERPADTAARLNAFLGGTLDSQAMARAVAPELRRQVYRAESIGKKGSQKVKSTFDSC